MAEDAHINRTLYPVYHEKGTIDGPIRLSLSGPDMERLKQILWIIVESDLYTTV